MAKIVLVGAGSYKFAKDIIMDIFLYPLSVAPSSLVSRSSTLPVSPLP